MKENEKGRVGWEERMKGRQEGEEEGRKILDHNHALLY